MSPISTAHRSIVLLVLLLALVCGCTGPRSANSLPASLTQDVFVIEHGKHAGIAIAWDAIPAGRLPPLADLPEGRYLEIGWGDRDYYQSSAPGLGLALKAALWPTASVLHIASLPEPPEVTFPLSGIIRLELSPKGFEALLDHLGASFALDSSGAPRPLGPGLYGQSQFYLSRERYHLLRTCNVWTAEALHRAGLPIAPLSTITTRTLFVRLQAHGEVLRPAHRR